MSCSCGGPWPGIGHTDECLAEVLGPYGDGSTFRRSTCCDGVDGHSWWCMEGEKAGWLGASSGLEGDGSEPVPDRPWTSLLWVCKPKDRELDETPADPQGLGNEPDAGGLPGWARGFGEASEGVLGAMARVERAAGWVERVTRDRRSPERRHAEETAGLTKRSGGSGKRAPGFRRFGTWGS